MFPASVLRPGSAQFLATQVGSQRREEDRPEESQQETVTRPSGASLSASLIWKEQQMQKGPKGRYTGLPRIAPIPLDETNYLWSASPGEEVRS
jgi:hypothetical protein